MTDRKIIGLYLQPLETYLLCNKFRGRKHYLFLLGVREGKVGESEKNSEGNDWSQALRNRYDFVKLVNRQHRDAMVRNRNSAREEPGCQSSRLWLWLRL